MEEWRALASAVPALAEQLFTQRPGHVYREALAVLEQALLSHALALTGGNQLRAARLLGLNRNTLRKRCRILGVRPERSRSPVAGHRPVGPADRAAGRPEIPESAVP